jgi:hypothetical protein
MQDMLSAPAPSYTARKAPSASNAPPDDGAMERLRRKMDALAQMAERQRGELASSLAGAGDGTPQGLVPRKSSFFFNADETAAAAAAAAPAVGPADVPGEELSSASCATEGPAER